MIAYLLKLDYSHKHVSNLVHLAHHAPKLQNIMRIQRDPISRESNTTNLFKLHFHQSHHWDHSYHYMKTFILPLINMTNGSGLALCSILVFDPFAGQTWWMKVWWTNNNPKLICSYYLESVESSGGCMFFYLFILHPLIWVFFGSDVPLVTQSDPGSENYGIANAHTVLRHWHDPNLSGTIQHRWMRQKKNVMPEIAWSQLRRRFTPGFENILQEGVNEGWYDMNHPLDV